MTAVAGLPAATRPARRPVGVRTTSAWELSKLRALARTRVVAAVCVAAPFLFVIALAVQSGAPTDTPFGRWVHESGFATPLVVLNFAGAWALPLLVAVVAGDTFSAEDHLGTWKTVLTRSAGRGQLFAGKLLAVAAWTVGVVALLAVSSLVAGELVGHQPLVGLGGQLVPAGRATELVLASWALQLGPALGYAAVGVLVSVATRSSPLGIGAPVVLGLLLQLLALVNGPQVIQTASLAGAALSWHGFWADPSFSAPAWEGLAASAGWVLACTGAAWLLFRRRAVPVG